MIWRHSVRGDDERESEQDHAALHALRQDAVYPPPADHERLLRFLEFAGLDTYDAEAGLRGIAREYAEQQMPSGRPGIA